MSGSASIGAFIRKALVLRAEETARGFENIGSGADKENATADGLLAMPSTNPRAS
eukprot:CAMPEP_0177699736 /NCGR_PEP_ID=MMETSP0484_2-20121128/5735_1 /TAXON_ID=354590 /ORGANISM="Rhodomonas lens, Strain RHODO" /LENGTH=54 /DNA_ID=CAMNT_0019210919 /DNA_START=479 /DNA_END=643 /DNA_ORIENTATION=-